MKKDLLFLWVPAFGIFFAVFGGVWTLVEPLGLSAGIQLWITIFIVSLFSSIIYFLGKRLYDTLKKNEQLKVIVEDSSNTSACCVLKQKVAKCPVGILNIHNEMQETIKTSLAEAEKSFKWFGLSAFNVVHNNKEIFERKKHVEFSFLIADPKNIDLASKNDDYYGDTVGKLGSKELISKSNEMLTALKKDVNKNIKVEYHNQMPTFRVIIVDGKKVYVSFYEKGKDALKTFQLEIEDGEDGSLADWFISFYEKSILTEKIINPT